MDLTGTTLVFDLDGTLVDTAPDLVRTLNHVLTSADAPPMALEDMRPFISFGARRMIVEGLLAANRVAEAEVVDPLFQTFLEFYAENVAVDSRPYEGIVAVLEGAEQAGARLAVCTNKMEKLSRLLLDELDMSRFFGTIAGRDTFPVCKPDPAHLTGTVERVGGDLKASVMVGDSATDVNTAKAAGVPCIAVSFGYTETPAKDLGADAVIDHYREFNEALGPLLT